MGCALRIILRLALWGEGEIRFICVPVPTGQPAYFIGCDGELFDGQVKYALTHLPIVVAEADAVSKLCQMQTQLWQGFIAAI